jgi:hypothetical protein
LLFDISLMMVFAVLLALTAYTYDFHDWSNLPAMDRVVSISTDNFDAYIAVRHGVYIIEKGNRKLKRTITHSDGIRGEVSAAGYDPERGSLWVLSSRNLLSIDPFSNASFSYDVPASGISSLGIGQGYLYLSDGARMFRMDKRTGQVDTTSPGNRRVAWFGPLSPYQPDSYPFLTPFVYRDQQLNAYPISALYPDGRRLFVGTEGDGVFLYSLTSKQPLAYWRFGPGVRGVDRIFKLDGGLWFVNDDELTRYDPQHDTWSYFPTPFNAWFPDSSLLLRSKILDLRRHEFILTVASDSSGYLIGTDRNLYFYRPRTNALTRQLKSVREITSMLVTPDTIFVATDAGLLTYDRRRRGLSLVNDTLRQAHFGVFGIAATDRHRYYGVYGGLETQDSTGEWQLITPPGFELSAHPAMLAAAGSKLFAGTDQGVIVLNEKNGIYTTLSTENGLLSNRVRTLYADDDYLWVGTDDGISRFNHHALFP